MDQIRMVKDENGDIYLSQEDLLKVMDERLKRFPQEYAQLKRPQEGKIVGINGKTSTQPPDEKEIAKHEGMENMLRGIMGMLDVDQGGENDS